MSDTHAIAFVRNEMLPQAEPPVTQRGLVKWLRENMFSTIPNTIMTLLSLYVIYVLLASVVPWLFNGVWSGDSIRDCRAALDGATGGCFAVIRERWPQLLFGSYPSNLLIRPTMAFFLLLLAAAPVLFSELPRRLLWFTALYPFLAYWLIWGGSIWVPLFTIATILLSWLVFRALESRSFFGAIVAALIVFVVVSIVLGGPVVALLDSIATIRLQPVESRSIGGFLLNFILGTTCLSLSLPLGIALALGRKSDLPFIKGLCVIIIEFVRGVPLITLLFVASVMLGFFLPGGVDFDLIIRVIIMITLFASAYIAEAIRGGLAALPKGQYEAADALGLDYWQAMRLIILPQALKISIPSIVNIALGLFKDTTLVSIISMADILGMTRQRIMNTSEWFGVYWELLGFAALLFFIVCYSISQYSQYLERKLATDHR